MQLLHNVNDAMANEELSKRIKTAIILTPIVVGSMLVMEAFIILILVALAAMMYEWRTLVPKLPTSTIMWFRRNHLWVHLLGYVYIIFSCVAMMVVRSIPESGLYLTLFIALCVIATDIGAYFGGKRFGRHKLAPRISPSKTWEGLACGAFASSCMGMVSLPMLGFSLLHAAFYGVLFAVIGQAGDLLESLIKRAAGVKDSSQLLPGHGGVLDRLDSHLAVFLVAFYLFVS